MKGVNVLTMAVLALVLELCIGGNAWANPETAESTTVKSTTVTSRVKTAPEKIIALSPHSVELLFSLGVGDKIIGTTDYADYPEAAKKIPRVGGYHGLDIEGIFAQQPDLIIAWRGGNAEEEVQRLAQLGLEVYQSHPQSLAQVADELEVLGAKVGQTQVGLERAQAFRERLASLRSDYGSKTKVRFFYQLWAQPLRGVAQGSWINEVMAGCGGENVLDSSYPDYPQVSIEAVLMAEPEVILQPSQHGADVSTGFDWSKWPEIPAVSNEHIFALNGDLLHRFSERILDGMEQVCERLEQVRQSKATNSH